MTRAQTATIRRRAEETAALFPALMIEADHIAQTVSAGLHGRRRAGPGETFWQHRPYAFGDPVSMIDWRQSARVADRLFIRQNEWEAAAAVYFWRDASPSLEYSSSKTLSSKKYRAEILMIALSILLSQAGERVALLGGADRPFHGRRAPERLLEALYADRAGEQAHTPPAASTASGARIVLFSDFFAGPEAIRAAALKLASANTTGILVQICDPAEEDFPFAGRVEFSNPGTAERLIFGEVGSLAKDYRDRFGAYREELSHLAQKLGWTFIAHRSDHAPQAALLWLYTALSDMPLGR